MFKTIALLTTLTLSSLTLVNAADVKAPSTITCAKTKSKNKTSYPVDAAAIKLMSKLGVVTCTRSRRVRKFLKANNITIKTVIATQSDIDNSRDKLDALGE